jgi:hypothetical protein
MSLTTGGSSHLDLDRSRFYAMIRSRPLAAIRAFLNYAGLKITIAVIALSIAGIADAKNYHDPFDASLSPTSQSAIGQASKGPSVRVVLSGSTGASMKALADWSTLCARWLNPASMIDQYDPQHFQDDLNRILAPNFRSIEYVYWNAPQSASRVDYILTLEISVAIGKHSFAENTIDLQGVLSDQGGSNKESFAGHGKSKLGFPAFNTHFREAKQAAFDQFAQSLNASHLLAAHNTSTPVSTQVETASTDVSPSSTAGTPGGVRGGLYEVEAKIPFNVLDSVYYDTATGNLALIGHHDDRFKGAGIPYLQHLATLLESPKPEFSLKWTPESSSRVDSLFARELTQQESDAQGARLGAMVDASGQISHTGTLMLPALGIYPIQDNRAPGDLGVEVGSWNGQQVLVMKVKPGSAAEKAGLKPSDFIGFVRSDRAAFSAAEFERQVRFAGAGAEIEVKYQRGNEWQTTKATLDAATDTNPWSGVNRYDVIGMMYRAANDPTAADVIELMGIVNTATAQNEQKASNQALRAMLAALGMESDLQHLQEVGAGSAPPYQDSYNFGLKLSRQMDSIFHLAGSPVQTSFESTVQQTHDPAGGVSKAFAEFDVQFVSKFKELLDPLIFRPGVGFQIPPELVEDEYQIHPEMTPEYLGVPRDSQLARLMLASDYLGKQLSNRQDLRRKIPGYQTQIEYQVNHPETNRRTNSAYRVWISVASVNAAQSTDGKALALRDVRMRFNIRETDNQQNDLPNQVPGGYEDVLTGLYDRFEQEFYPLHELREAAKLAVVSKWMQAQNSGIRLPAEGRESWNGPEKVDGLIYFYLTTNLQQQSKIFKIAEGGVSLAPGEIQFPVDSSVVDLRESPATSVIFTKPGNAIVRDGSGVSSADHSPYASGWITSVVGGTSGQDAVVLEAGYTGQQNRGQATAAFPDEAEKAGMRDAVRDQTGGPQTSAQFNPAANTPEAREIQNSAPAPGPKPHASTLDALRSAGSEGTNNLFQGGPSGTSNAKPSAVTPSSAVATPAASSPVLTPAQQKVLAADPNYQRYVAAIQQNAEAEQKQRAKANQLRDQYLKTPDSDPDKQAKHVAAAAADAEADRLGNLRWQNEELKKIEEEKVEEGAPILLPKKQDPKEPSR